MRLKNVALKVTLSSTLVTSSLSGAALTTALAVSPNVTHAAQAGVGGVAAAPTGSTSGTALGQFQVSDRFAVLQVGFVTNPDSLLSQDATSDALEDPFKFDHQLENTMFYIAPNKVTDQMFRKEGSGLIGYSSSEGVQTLYGSNPLYQDGPTSNASHADLMNKTLDYADVAKGSTNYFEQVIGRALVSIAPTDANRTLSGTSGSQPVGSSLKSILERSVVKGERADIDKDINQSMILDGYLNLIKDRGILSDASYSAFEAQIHEAFKANKLTLVFQTVIGVSIKDNQAPTNRTYAFMPAHDATNWYLDIQKAAKPNDQKVQSLTANREAEAVTYGGAAKAEAGAYSPYAENGNLPFSFRSYMRDYYGKTLKPVTSQVPLASDVATNPFGGWGFQSWLSNDSSVTNTPGIDAQLHVQVVDRNGKPTGEEFEEPVKGWSTVSQKLLSTLVNQDSTTLSDTMTVSHNGNLYDILPDENARFTLLDKKDGENLNKSILNVASPAQDGSIAIPSLFDPDKWELILGYDTPSALDLNKYLGGDGPSSTENKYASTGKYSNAQVTVYVKAQLDAPDDPITSTLEVPQWRLSQYWPNVSPKVTNKARFGLSLPIQTYLSPSISPSGQQTFSLINQSTPVPWATTRPILVNDKATKPVTLTTTTASFRESGDFLAVKDNSSVSKVKLADWLRNFSLFNGNIGSTSQGSFDPTDMITKSSSFSYGVKAPASVYQYSETRYNSVNDYDEDGNIIGSHQVPYTWTGNASQSTQTADYNLTVDFKHYVPKDSATPKAFDPSFEKGNGYYWQTQTAKDILQVNPEVLMAYDDASGNTSVTFTAGEKLRPIQPVSYNQAKVINPQVIPTVTGMTTATDPNATSLAQRIAPGKDVIYKGSSAVTSFAVQGDLEVKTFALDISSSPLKQAWNPQLSYSTDIINDDYLKQYATLDQATGKWIATFDASGNYVINQKDFGGVSSKQQVEQKSQTVVNHKLEIRGGRLVGVDGSRDLSNLSNDLITALNRMHIATDDNILNTFARNEGDALTEQKVATLGNAVRGSQDLVVGKGFYNEDTTVLIVREYTTTFALPSFQYTDKLPMELTPDLATPIDKTKFFTTGAPIFTKLQLQLGNVLFTADSSKGELGVPQAPQATVPNVSVMDTFNSVQ